MPTAQFNPNTGQPMKAGEVAVKDGITYTAAPAAAPTKLVSGGTYNAGQSVVDASGNVGVVKYDANTGKLLTNANSSTTVPMPNANTPVTSSALAPSTPTNYKSPTSTPAYPVSTLSTPKLQPTDAEKKASALSDKLQGLYDSTVGQSAYRTSQESIYGIDALSKTQNDLTTQLQGIKNEAAAIPLQLMQGANERGVTTNMLGRQENSRLRTNAIAALGVSSLLEASRGNLATAQAQVEKAVAQKYDPIKEQIAAATQNLDLILRDPKTSLEDKNRAQEQLDIQNAKLKEVQAQEQNSSEVYNIATTAASNGQSFTATAEYPSLAVALQAITQAPSKEQALQIASAVGLVGGASGFGTMSASEGAKLLSPTEAKSLGVSYGTTRGQAAEMGIIPGGNTTPKEPSPTQVLQTAKSIVTKTLQTGSTPDGQKIGNGRGADGFTDPYVYLSALNSWLAEFKTVEEFVKAFPVKTNVNPASYKLLPVSIQPTDASSGRTK